MLNKVKEIRQLKGKLKIVDIAQKYGVCFQNISNIINHKIWVDVK